ncbi:MAG: hypothetical protein NVSMB3_06930 [Acidobacteriaceae bacterium]
MTGLQTLTARLALGGVGAAAGVVLSSLGSVDRPSPAQFRRLVSAAFLLSRLTLFALVFVILRVAPRGDVPGYYFPEATAALHGALPYRDFLSSYAPLHSYVDGVVLLLWNSQLALILFAIAVEFLLLLLWLRLGPQLLPERDLRVGAILYATSSISLQYVVLDGQDNVLVALLILLALWLALRSRLALSGIFVALAAVMVKLIPLFYAPVFLAGLRRRWAWTLGFAGVVALGYGSFALLRVPLLQPLALEGPLKSAGTLPYVVESITGLELSVRTWRVILLLMLGLTCGVVWRLVGDASDRARVRAVLWGISACTLVLLLFATKSWPAYLVLILFPLCMVAAGSGVWGRVAFSLFGIVAVVEHSYWATLLGEASAPELHQALLRSEPQSLFFLLLELLLLAGYGWLLRACLGRVEQRDQPTAEGRESLPVVVG